MVRLINPYSKFVAYHLQAILIIMCHSKVFLLESNAKQETYMKHTLTSELSTLSKNHWGLLKCLFHKKNFQNLIFRPVIL